MPSPVPSTPPSPADLQLIQELAAMAPPSRANFTPPALLDPNYIPPDRGGAIIGVTVVTTLVAFAAVCIRIYGFAIAQCVFTVLEVKRGGAGRHSYDISIDETINLTLYGFILVEIYNTVSCLTKLSVLCFIHRLLVPSRARDLIFRSMCVFFGLLWIASFFETIYQCKPIAVSWDLRVLAANKGGVCHNQISTGLAFSAIFVATDVVLLALPIWVVLKLHSIERGRKIGVIFMFSLGGLTCLFCLLKLIYLHADISGPDPSWTLISILILNSLEINVAIIITCLPVLKGLFRQAKQNSRPGFTQRYSAEPDSGHCPPDPDSYTGYLSESHKDQSNTSQASQNKGGAIVFRAESNDLEDLPSSESTRVAV